MPLEVTNAQKLSLPANTAVGTQVKVSDGFVQAGGSDPTTDAFYAYDGGSFNGKPTYSNAVLLALNYGKYQYDGSKWVASNGEEAASGNEDFPWLANWTGAGLTLTHPAVQQLAAPSTAQGGVFVSGISPLVFRFDIPTEPTGCTVDVPFVIYSDFKLYFDDSIPLSSSALVGGNIKIGWSDLPASSQMVDKIIALSPIPADHPSTDRVRFRDTTHVFDDLVLEPQNGEGQISLVTVDQEGAVESGIFIDRGVLNGRRAYTLLGGANPDPSGNDGAISWTGSQWNNYQADTQTLLFYSNDDVSTPDLITNWKNASDDSPASITVTSVTAGQIAAGIKFGSTFYVITTPVNGRNSYRDVLGVAPDFTFNGTIWTDGTHNGTGTPAFPWDVTGITITQDNVAAEANWEVSSALSNDATLLSLTPSYGSLSPAFNPAVISYTLNGRVGTTLTAIANDAGATVTSPITLNPGANSITVTAADGITTITYTVTMLVIAEPGFGQLGFLPAHRNAEALLYGIYVRARAGDIIASGSAAYQLPSARSRTASGAFTIRAQGKIKVRGTSLAITNRAGPVRRPTVILGQTVENIDDKEAMALISGLL